MKLNKFMITSSRPLNLLVGKRASTNQIQPFFLPAMAVMLSLGSFLFYFSHPLLPRHCSYCVLILSTVRCSYLSGLTSLPSPGLGCQCSVSCEYINNNKAVAIAVAIKFYELGRGLKLVVCSGILSFTKNS